MQHLRTIYLPVSTIQPKGMLCAKKTSFTAEKFCIAVFVIFFLSVVAAIGAAEESQEERWEKLLFDEYSERVRGYCVEQTTDEIYAVTGYYHRHWEAGG